MSNLALTDRFGRHVEYLRLSVTDRCDFRCIYCMAEDMTFLPRKEVLSLEELAQVATAFVELGVKKIRLTGGEPLIRKDVPHLFTELGRLSDLQELCLTTNGSHLAQNARSLKDAGLNRINISLDTLDPDRFRQLTRYGDLRQVLTGIDVAREFAFDSIKINSVLMKNYNLDEAVSLARFALEREMDISFIEEMPLGEVKTHSRNAEYISSEELRHILEHDFQLTPSSVSTGGPSRYWRVKGYENKIGFISPHSDNFCSTCNRVRVSASGRLLLCLGNEHSVDLKRVLRESPGDLTLLKQTIVDAMQIKPEKHEFDLDEAPQILRFMNATGG